MWQTAVTKEVNLLDREINNSCSFDHPKDGSNCPNFLWSVCGKTCNNKDFTCTDKQCVVFIPVILDVTVGFSSSVSVRYQRYFAIFKEKLHSIFSCHVLLISNNTVQIRVYNFTLHWRQSGKRCSCISDQNDRFRFQISDFWGSIEFQAIPNLWLSRTGIRIKSELESDRQSHSFHSLKTHWIQNTKQLPLFVFLDTWK